MDGKSITLLLIEDNEDDALIIREALSQAKGGRFDLEWANQFSTGLERLAEGGIDVVLLDLGLPDSGGLDALGRVHATAPDVPVLVLTGLEDETLAVKAVREGAQDYLFKGQVDGNLLARTLRYAIKRQRMLSELGPRTQELQVSEMRFRAIIEKAADSIIIVDGNGIVHFVNPAAESLFGRRGEDLLGEPFGFPVVARETTELTILRTGGDTATAEMRVVETIWEGERAYLASLRDITELVRLREELRAMSLLDDLTGLYNRRGFFTLAQQQLKLADRAQTGMLLLVADLDGLKGINDTLGHHVGDLALIETAQVLKETFRESDVVARTGGDEFAVLAVEASGPSAEILTTRLQEHLEARNAQEDRRYKLSLSFGVARFDPENPSSIEALMRGADARMYEHKQSKGDPKGFRNL